MSLVSVNKCVYDGFRGFVWLVCLHWILGMPFKGRGFSTGNEDAMDLFQIRVTIRCFCSHIVCHGDSTKKYHYLL